MNLQIDQDYSYINSIQVETIQDENINSVALDNILNKTKSLENISQNSSAKKTIGVSKENIGTQNSIGYIDGSYDTTVLFINSSQYYIYYILILDYIFFLKKRMSRLVEDLVTKNKDLSIALNQVQYNIFISIITSYYALLSIITR